MPTPTHRLAVLVALFAVVSACAVVSMNCAGVRRFVTRAPAGGAGQRTTQLEPSVAERLAALDARLRLRPDRRFLYAVQELAMLVGPDAGESVDPVELRSRVGSWEIVHDGVAIGTLPELAAFGDMLALLDGFAERLRADDTRVLVSDGQVTPDLQFLLDRYDDVAAFRVLEQVDARWREGRASVGDLRAAAHALAQLSLILQDDLEIADAVRGRALATLALARSYGRDDVLRAECLLAVALRYSSHARSQAARLPPDDPLVPLVTADLAALRDRVRTRRPTPEERFFYAYRLGRENLYAEWFEWLRGLPADARSLALVRTYVDQRDLRSMRWVPDHLALLVQRVVGVPDPETDGVDVLARADDFLSHLARAAAGKQGPFASADAYRVYYEALYFSALHTKYELYRWMLGSPDGLTHLARSLATSLDPRVRDFAEFVEISNPTLKGGVVTARRWKALEADSVLGASQRFGLALSLYLPMFLDSPDRLGVAAVMEPRFDARPQHLIWASQLARQVYADPALTQRLDEATVALDEVDRVELRLELARARGDEAALWKLLEEGRLSPEHRIDALGELAKLEHPDLARIRTTYARELAAPDPQRFAYLGYAEFLEEVEKDRPAARRALERFIADPGESSGIVLSKVRARIAQLYRKDGDPASGWDTLQPELEGSPPYAVFWEAVRLQIALGNFPLAEQIARRSLARYDGASSTADLTRALWHQGRHAEAAQAIAECGDRTSQHARNQLIWAFVDTFGKEETPGRDAAFGELVKTNLGLDLLQGTIATLRSEGRAEAAFQLGLLMNDPPAEIRLHTEAYKSLKLARGENEALQWIRSVLPASYLDVSAELFYICKADELLWTMTTDPDAGHGGARTWMLRAAASLRESPPLAEHRQRLMTYYAGKRASASFDDRLGAALLGLEPEQALLESVRSEEELSLAATLLALRAESQGHPREALRMYQLARSNRHPSQLANVESQAGVSRLQEGWAKLEREAIAASH